MYWLRSEAMRPRVSPSATLGEGAVRIVRARVEEGAVLVVAGRVLFVVSQHRPEDCSVDRDLDGVDECGEARLGWCGASHACECITLRVGWSAWMN